jgi:3-phosphoshikimate 1-carboxyvinyltransferase
MSYPDRLEIVPLASAPIAEVEVPGSKSITNRALVLASILSKSLDAELHGALRCDDTEVMIDCLRRLGYSVKVDWENNGHIVVNSGDCDEDHPIKETKLFVGNSGTSMRFLSALAARASRLCNEFYQRYVLDGVPRMRERPIEDLLAALRQLGVRAESINGNGCPPVLIESRGLFGGTVNIRGDISSQFLSGLLMVAPEADDSVTIRVEGPLVSRPYVDMTLAMMRQMGDYRIDTPEPNIFHVHKCFTYGMEPYSIEPDASAASYFWAAAAIMGGFVRVEWITRNSLQGDVRVVDALEKMGCRVVHDDFGIGVRGAPLHGIDIDMNDISDTVMTLAAVACFAEGPTTIRNVAHIRHKETDRLAALATELRRLGAEVDEFADGLTITPRPLHGAEVDTYNDHRMAMSLALIGLRVPGVVIKNPGCVAKTYPDFFRDLEALR